MSRIAQPVDGDDDWRTSGPRPCPQRERSTTSLRWMPPVVAGVERPVDQVALAAGTGYILGTNKCPRRGHDGDASEALGSPRAFGKARAARQSLSVECARWRARRKPPAKPAANTPNNQSHLGASTSKNRKWKWPLCVFWKMNSKATMTSTAAMTFLA